MSPTNSILDSLATCPACGGSTRQTVGELAFTRSGFTVTVTDVPMSVCDSCGEQYVPGPLGVELSDLVEEMMNRIEDAAGGTDSAARPRSLVLQASRLAKPVPVP